MKRIGTLAAWLLGAFLVVRAVVEPFVVDVGDPTTYRDDWGGPTLVGVLAVHMLPGVVAAAALTASVIRRRRPR